MKKSDVPERNLVMLTKEDLQNFEKEIADIFATGVIRAPVHLRAGREERLIKIFKDHAIGPDDYVFGHWDSHELALLKGVPREEVKQAVLDGKSISLCFPEYKVFCSGIVGSLMGTATGVAWALKRQGKKGKSYIFCGDMSSETGIFHEAVKIVSGLAVEAADLKTIDVGDLDRGQKNRLLKIFLRLDGDIFLLTVRRLHIMDVDLILDERVEAFLKFIVRKRLNVFIIEGEDQVMDAQSLKIRIRARFDLSDIISFIGPIPLDADILPHAEGRGLVFFRRFGRIKFRKNIIRRF